MCQHTETPATRQHLPGFCIMLSISAGVLGIWCTENKIKLQSWKNYLILIDTKAHRVWTDGLYTCLPLECSFCSHRCIAASTLSVGLPFKINMNSRILTLWGSNRPEIPPHSCRIFTHLSNHQVEKDVANHPIGFLKWVDTHSMCNST